MGHIALPSQVREQRPGVKVEPLIGASKHMGQKFSKKRRGTR